MTDAMSLQRQILLVDDDLALRSSLAEQLSELESFKVVEAGTIAEALSTVRSGIRLDGLILDVGLPDGDGRSLCQTLRDEGVRAPILMLTSADSDDDTVRGLSAGANDYVAKPFRLAVLMARLKAQLRQFEASDDASFTVGVFEFKPAAKMLIDEAGGRKVKLTEKETQILKYLYRAGGKTVGRDVLLGEVWGYNADVTTHTLETHVYRLRQKIATEGEASSLIVTEPGGYRLVP